MTIRGKRAAKERIHSVHCTMRKNVVLSHKPEAIYG